MVEAARVKCATKVAPDTLTKVRVDVVKEGLCGQTLHVGSYDNEGPTVAALHDAIADAGLELAGKHHEIYLSDIRRTAPEKLKTILRQQVRRP